MPTLTDFLARFDEEPEGDRDGYRLHCPAHEDSQASLRVTVSDAGKVLVKCRAGCATADVLKAKGLTMRDLATMTASDEEIDFSRATSTDAPASVEDVARLAVDLDRWAAALSPEAEAYALDRFGLSARDAARLGLGSAPSASYDVNGEITNGGLPGGPRLVVPFRDRDGVPRGFQARALAKDAKVRWLGPESPDGASWAKVGFFPGGSGWDEVLVTEGPGDSLTGVALGYDTVMIRGAGLASNESVVDEVAALIGPRLAVIAGDGDPAGRTFSSRLAQGLLARGLRVKILAVPDDLDLTDWRERDGHRFATEVVRKIAETKEEIAADVILTERDLVRYPFTDLGNARFVRDYVAASGSGVKFSPEAGFFLLKGGVWYSDRLDRTRAFVQEAADRTETIARSLRDNAPRGEDGQVSEKAAKEAGRWMRWATYSQSTKGISAALKELQALPDVATDVNDFDRHDDLLAVENGVVDLKSGALMPHDPALLLTKKVGVEYDVNARAPRWEAFLEEVFPNHPDLPAFIRRLVGYGITGRTDEQAFAVLWGTGANGKSVFTDTLTEIFRDLTVTTPFSTFEERSSGGIPNDLAALKGARLVMAAEGDQGRPMAEAVLKRVTGRDLIAARFMRKEFFEFRPSFLLMLATNFKPKFRGQDEGLWRRVKLIPWERYFAPHERDHHLSDTLLGEAKGILAWAVKGSVEWYARGLQDPEIVRASTLEYRETSDALAGFLPGVFVKDPAAPRIDGGMLFGSYLEWADAENLPPKERWTRQTFYGALEERGAVKRKTKKGVAFEGIRRPRQSEIGTDPEEGRAAEEPLALSPSDTPTPSRGPSLADL